MAEQLSFDLPVRVAKGREAFFVAHPNALAVSALDQRTTWPQRKMILQGPRACGKTHLLDIWCAENSGLAIDVTKDIDLPALGSCVAVDNLEHLAGNDAAQTRLFHLHNHLAATDGFLLMAAPGPIAELGLSLPDLVSRLQAAPVARIYGPDEDLLRAVLLKGFMDRQVSPNPAVQAYILKHMDRTFAAATQIVATLDQLSMTQKRPITRAMAADVIAKM